MSLIIDIHSTMLHGYLNLVSEKGKKLTNLQVFTRITNLQFFTRFHWTEYLFKYFETFERIWREESQDILGVEGTRQ